MIVPDQNCDRVRRCSVRALGEAEGVVYLQALRRSTPSAGPRPLDGINGHQVAVGKRLRNHDEQLMLIIPVVGRY
ncbi:hypothetical protein A2U01_0050614, partial [Trifolium medium]|nr:hypothetical protein [Trifolium medium]